MSRAHHPMTKQSPPNPVSTTPGSKSLEERLNRQPELRTKIESLLSVVENAEGDLVKANEAEQRVIEEIRQLGQVALQGWATRQNQVQTDQGSVSPSTEKKEHYSKSLR